MRDRENSSELRGRPYPKVTNLGKIMYHLRLSASKLAGETGVHPRTLTEILAGRKRPSFQQQSRISEYLDVPAEQLFPNEKAEQS